ncbi:MAG: hydroxyacid dehydrogenase [Eubacteriales bacterium]|nr:hydroxyacid dehydrogenase [Eubacteriales bacterium]
MKFVMTQALAGEGVKVLKKEAGEDLEIVVADKGNPNDYLEEMQDADALIVRIGSCDRKAIENSPALRVIGRTGIGFDSIDINAATESGIPVVITPGASARSVAEHTMAMLLALSKNLSEMHSELLQGNWQIRDSGKSFELYGKTIGIIGTGAVGRALIPMCKGFGMNVIGYHPRLSKTEKKAFGISFASDLKELLCVSDILTLHVPLKEDTRKMIGVEEINLMKTGSILINCSRGGVVDEAALVKALETGKLAGAGTDVFEMEPPKTESGILHAPNLLVTPHAAALTKEAAAQTAVQCAAGCLAVLRGEQWQAVANPEVYQHPRWKERMSQNETSK